MIQIYPKRKGRNTDKRKVNKSNTPDKVAKRDESNKSEERMYENEEKHEKKVGAYEIKEKSKIQNAECNDSVTLGTDNGEKLLMIRMKYLGMEEMEMVGSWILEENMMMIKGTFLKR